MKIIGIDPGLTGAISLVSREEVVVFDTPTCKLRMGRKTKTEYLPLEMAEVLQSLAKSDCHVFMEKVHSMPGQGVASTFNFGKGFGIWIGILAALKIPYSLITPQAWKKKLMCGMPDKDASRIRAQQLYPQAANYLNLKKHHGRAESLLIAHYGKYFC